MHSARAFLLAAIAFFVAAAPLLSAFLDPTENEKDFYKQVRKRLTDDPAFGKPDPTQNGDPRIDVSEFLTCESAPKLVTTHDCPTESRVKKIEVYVVFRLVKWQAADSKAGKLTLEKTESVIDKTKSVKKLTYSYAVSFDAHLGAKAEQDAIGKWLNAGLLYHEMMHGQLTINRIKDPQWRGWGAACKCQTPGPDIIGTGVNTEEDDHKKIEPAQDEYTKAAVEAKEKESVTVIPVQGVAKPTDKDGNRDFETEVAVPAAFAEKRELKTKLFWRGTFVGEPNDTYDPKTDKVKITGTLKDDGYGVVYVILDPNALVAIVHLSIDSPAAANHRPPIAPEWRDRRRLWVWLAGIVLLVIVALILSRRRS